MLVVFWPPRASMCRMSSKTLITTTGTSTNTTTRNQMDGWNERAGFVWYASVNEWGGKFSKSVYNGKHTAKGCIVLVCVYVGGYCMFINNNIYSVYIHRALLAVCLPACLPGLGSAIMMSCMYSYMDGWHRQHEHCVHTLTCFRRWLVDYVSNVVDRLLLLYLLYLQCLCLAHPTFSRI